MRDLRAVLMVAVLPAALVLAADARAAQSQGQSGGKIICWKDKSGKVIGCGDKVPPEYQDSATKELNQRGVTIRQSDAPLSAEQRRALEADAKRKQAETAEREEQRRQDRAILDTFTSAQEIDLKRRRDAQPIESTMETLQNTLKTASRRHAEAGARVEQSKKSNKPVPPAAQQEFEHAEKEKTRIESQIAQKRKEIADLNQKYDEIRRRFLELTSAKSAPQSAPGAAAGRK